MGSQEQPHMRDLPVTWGALAKPSLRCTVGEEVSEKRDNFVLRQNPEFLDAAVANPEFPPKRFSEPVSRLRRHALNRSPRRVRL